MNHPLSMYRYHTWANQTILNRIEELPAELLNQPVHSSFATIAHALSHLHAVDTMWLMILKGTGMPEALKACMPLNQTLLPSVEAYREAFEHLAGQFGEWFQNGYDLEQTVLLDNPFSGPRHTLLSEMIVHLVNHGTYHRGNISTMLRQLGHASVMTDYSWYWYQNAEVTG